MWITSAMLNKYKRIIVFGFMVCWGPLVLGQPGGPAEAVKNADNASSVAGAGKAVFGRVFGFQDQGGDVDYYTFDLSKRDRFNSTVRSAFIPGWGQAFNEQRVKGGALFFTTSLALAGSIILHNKSKDSFDDYQAEGRINGSKFDDYETERIQSIVLGSAAAALWVYGLIDAYRNAYNPLWSKNTSIELSLLPHESHIHWKRRF